MSLGGAVSPAVTWAPSEKGPAGGRDPDFAADPPRARAPWAALSRCSKAALSEVVFSKPIYK